MCHRWPPLLPLEAKLEALNNAFIAFILLDTTVFTSFSIFLQLYIIITPLKNTSYLLSGLCNILSHINYTSITSANVPVIDTITFMEDNFKSPRFYSIISSNEPSYRVKIRKHLPSNSKECPVKSETTLSSKKKKKRETSSSNLQHTQLKQYVGKTLAECKTYKFHQGMRISKTPYRKQKAAQLDHKVHYKR